MLSKKGIKLGVVSNAPGIQVWIKLASFKMHHLFDVVVTLDDTGVKKPNKLPFNKALIELGFDAEEVLMVGDRPDVDIIGAKKLGIKGVFARYGSTEKECPEADYIINDIQEIINVVEELNHNLEA